MAVNEKHIEWLYRAQDGTLSPKEAQELSEALMHSAELRAERDKLQRLQTLLGGLTPAESKGFTSRVMAAIQKQALPQRWLYQVAAACLLLITVSLFTLYLSEGSLSTDTLIGVEELQPEDAMTLTGEWSIN